MKIVFDVVDTGGFDRKIEKLGALIQSVAQRTAIETTDEFFNQVKVNISMPMHAATPEKHYYALGRDYDHPFAARHFAIRTHGHLPIWSVHSVTGKMLSTLQRTYELRGRQSAFGHIGWNPATASQDIRDVLQGTSLMLPRPVLRLTAEQMDIEKIMMDKFNRYSGIN